jgi:hypothetical protein
MSSRGITITNYLTKGNPEGIIFSYMSNWTGQAIKLTRNLFADAKDISELYKPGVYFLFGSKDENPEDKLVYIGEANKLVERISQQLRDDDKSFVEIIICFCSKDENLTVSHTKYLEQKIISQVSKSTQYSLVNKKEGNSINLPPMSKDEMDTFYDNMKVILPTLGYPILHSDIPYNPIARTIDLILNIGKTKATARLTPNGIEVLKGSEMNPKDNLSLSGSYSNLRKTLLSKGIIKMKSSKHIFTENYEFPSPSAAAAIILGYSINGRTAWKNEQGKNLKDIEEERLSLD